MPFGDLTGGCQLLAVLPLLPAAVSLSAMLLAAFFSTLAAVAALRPAALARLGRILWRQKPGLFVIGLMLVALAAAMRFGAQPSPHTVPVGFRSGNWPMFRGDLARNGHADERPGPLKGGVQWVAGRGYQFWSSPAVVGDAVVAVGCRGDSAQFFCWQASGGKLLATFAPPDYRATFSSPIVSGGHLICGEGVHGTPNSRVVAYRVDETNNLVPDFDFPTKGHVECTPTIAAGRLYFGAGDDGVYCLDISSTGAGGVVWHLPGKSYRDAETALAVHDGRVYLGLGHGGEAVCIIDAATGEELVRRKLPYPVFSPPAIARGRVYLGLGPADYVHQRPDSPGEVRCLDLKTLATIWTLPTSASVLSAIVLREAGLVVATVGGELLAVNFQGEVTHRWRASAPILSAPAVTDETIYCVSCDGTLYGLQDALKPVWRVTLGTPGLYTSSPVVFGGRIVVGTPDGFMSVGEPAERSASRQRDER